jgi:hypothetical protein
MMHHFSIMDVCVSIQSGAIALCAALLENKDSGLRSLQVRIEFIVPLPPPPPPPPPLPLVLIRALLALSSWIVIKSAMPQV